jgi:orotidine-5'-phosphate decarboxylase
VNARDRLIVALDLPSVAEADALVDRLAGHVGMFKVGSQLFSAGGIEVVRRLVARGERVFLDLKYHDIPNTVASAVAAAGRLGVTLVDVHALGGSAMVAAAAKAKAGVDQRLLAITILTSHDAKTLAELGLAGPVPEAVVRLARLAQNAGADGVVASPHEVALIRQACGKDFLIVTPGIRPLGASLGDQARAATPATAIAAGTDYIVVGRPILEASDPAAAADAITAEIESAQTGTP